MAKGRGKPCSRFTRRYCWSLKGHKSVPCHRHLIGRARIHHRVSKRCRSKLTGRFIPSRRCARACR